MRAARRAAGELRSKIEKQREQHTPTAARGTRSFHRPRTPSCRAAGVPDQEDYGLKAYDQWRNLALKLTGTGAIARAPSSAVPAAPSATPAIQRDRLRVAHAGER